MTIRWKLLLLALAPTILAAGLLMGYSLWSFQDYFVDTTRADLHARAQVLADALAEVMEVEGAGAATVLASRTAAGPGVAARVFRTDGTLLASSMLELDAGYDRWKSVPGVAEALAGRSAEGVGPGVQATGERFYASRPIVRKGQILGAVRVSLSLDEFHQQMARNLQGQLAALAAVLIVCAVLCVLLARGLSGTIHQMARYAARVGAGHLGETLAVPSRDELGLLAGELNRMSERLAAADETRRTLLANATHEFLTPVTNVQVTLEALQAGAAADPELRERFLESAYEEMERLQHLLQDLLDLGRLEAGIAALRRQSCPLQPLLERCLRAIEPRLQAQKVAASLTGAELTVSADPERLQQAFLAILDNALKHSAPGGAITVRIEREGDLAHVAIRDAGPGIPAGDLPHVFETFFVGDESRTGTSTGLGLAIALSIIQAHGGRITATSPHQGGAEFIVSLKTEPAPPRDPLSFG